MPIMRLYKAYGGWWRIDVGTDLIVRLGTRNKVLAQQKFERYLKTEEQLHRNALART